MLMAGLVVYLLAPMAAQAADEIQYSPQAVNDALARGCTVFLDFNATW
jgi:hypothetical protein